MKANDGRIAGFYSVQSNNDQLGRQPAKGDDVLRRRHLEVDKEFKTLCGNMIPIDKPIKKCSSYEKTKI